MLGVRKEQRFEVDGKARLQNCQTIINRRTVGRKRLNPIGLIERAAHVGILGATAGEHPDEFRRYFRRLLCNDRLGIRRIQKRNGLLPVAADHALPIGKLLAPDLQGIGHIGQVQCGCAAQMLRQLLPGFFQRGWRFGR